ncbi:hypothetical protein ACLI4Y_08985 [Natrialbaceae archaeon A-CW3]
MEKTPRGTSVGVDDPYAFAGVCDYLTGEGRCRYAYDHYQHDPEFARERAAEDYACLVVDPEAGFESGCGGCSSAANSDDLPEWGACPHFRSRNHDRECVRCGLEERRIASEHTGADGTGVRPLLEEHHLSYARDGRTLSHEITVYLCRWCHAKVHGSWARITDDVAPDPEALAAQEGRRSRELEETAFETAAERVERDD